MDEDKEGRTERFGGKGDPDRTGFTRISPMLRPAAQAEIVGRSENIDNLPPRIRAASKANRLAALAAIIGDLAEPSKVGDPDFLLRKIRSAINLTLPSERGGLREVLLGVKSRLPSDADVQILHDKKTAQRKNGTNDWKVVVDFGGRMFSV